MYSGVDIRVFPSLQGAIAPFPDIYIRFLIQLTDRRRCYLAAPQRLGDILDTANRYPCCSYLAACVRASVSFSSKPLSVSSTLPHTSAFNSLLMISSCSCTIFWTLIALPFGEFGCDTFILPKGVDLCPFFLFAHLCALILLVCTVMAARVSFTATFILCDYTGDLLHT